MTREEYLTELFKAYSPIAILSDKNECKVLRVKHKTLGKYIVIRSFQKSVDAYEKLYNIACDNLPLIYDVINLDDGQIVLEEFISGVTVAEVMESGKYRYIGAKKVLKAVCNALTVLHERNIVHRDIKPENIIISDDGKIVLIDFNASREIKKADKDTVIMGTVGYASPEQLGIMQSDARTDIYALGILLNVMLTGHHPSEKIAKGKVGKIVRKCTSINPDERYKNVESFLDSL